MRSGSECVNSWLWLLPGVRKRAATQYAFKRVTSHNHLFFHSLEKKKKKKKKPSNRMRHHSHAFCRGRSPPLSGFVPPFGSIISEVRQWQWVSDNIHLIAWWLLQETLTTGIFMALLLVEDEYRSLWQSNHTTGTLWSLSTQGQSDLCRFNQKSPGFKTISKYFLYNPLSQGAKRLPKNSNYQEEAVK